MKIKIIGVLFVLLTLLVVNSFAQNSSNKGKDFWVAYAAHIDNLNSKLTLFLSADQETTYEVNIGNTVVFTGKISANTCVPIIINPSIFAVYISGSDVTATNRAIRVTTVKPISLYSVISNSARTGGTMVLPANTLGKDYYTFSYQSSTNANFAQFTIIATEDNTEVEITPTRNEANGRYQANQTFTKKLNKGDIYQYQSTSDLSGSRVRSVNGCKPIAVFSGNTWASFCEQGNGRSPSGGDNLYQQVFPVSSWGKKFVTAPFYNTTNGNTEILRIIVSDDNTVVTVNGSTTTANGTPLANPYQKGAIITFFSTRANVISATKPISVAQYQTSQTCNLSNPANNQGVIPFPGDPEITVLNPVEQTLNNITVYSKLENVATNIDKFYLNVIIKTIDAASFRLDGNPVTGFVPIDTEYSYVIIDVTNLQPQHRLTASGGFSAIAYGYGNVESYAYLAGANIQDFTFQLENISTSQSISIGCINQNIRLKINLPYEASNLVWNVNNGDGIVNQVNPTFASKFNKDAVTYYTYYYPNPIVYTKVGDYVFSVVATKPSADACGATEELTAEFTVDPLPVANFTAVTTVCANKEVSFTDKSMPNITGKVLTKWQWDFGDGTTSVLQNPVHIYANAGKYTVSLIAGAENGCLSEVFSQDITVYHNPISSFKVNQNTCVATEITFTDQSTIAQGSIVKWLWDMGDGKPVMEKTANTAFTYKYDTPGNYLVKLITESDKGCLSTSFDLPIKVTILPIAEFNIPDVCLADAQAVFTNSSLNADGTIAGLTYEWDFGDPASGVLNFSTQREGRHKYNAAKSYKVTLTITNENKCKVVLQKDFVVNGSFPLADFKVVDENNLCSNKPFSLINKSAVDFGGVTKIEWFFNGIKHSEDLQPTPDKVYSFSFQPFTSPLAKQVDVRMLVYSGGVCTNEITKRITLLAAPVVDFKPLTAVCLNFGNVQFVATETGNVPGNGIYTGKGVSLSGLFDPVQAGVGLHDITYTFTSTAGCIDAVTQQIEVYPIPTVNAGAELILLAGGEKKIEATATGDIKTYKWTPSVGLDRDDILNPTASPTVDTKYILTVTSNQGCQVSSEVFVRVLQSINAPNSFTPNGDGVNDFWNVKYLDTYPNSSVEVFNRNGDRVFFSKGYAVPFDGNFNNKPLPVGTYYYIINPNSGRKSITGALTIIR